MPRRTGFTLIELLVVIAVLKDGIARLAQVAARSPLHTRWSCRFDPVKTLEVLAKQVGEADLTTTIGT
jgi:Tfp pilus assembly protein PilE